jgi:glyoxylase-like metal-dependent hydrolase (beta-lactamase superfamily II)
LRRPLESLGEPRFVVAASAIHGHRFMEQYRATYAQVELFAPPVLDRRRKDLAFDGLLGTAPDPRWCDDLDQTPFLGHLIPEVVFLHRASGTLIVGDLLVHEIRAAAPRATRWAWRLEGTYGSLAVPRTLRFATRSRRSARAAAERILSWDFDRIIVGHGNVVESGGKAGFEQAMRWLLRDL